MLYLSYRLSRGQLGFWVVSVMLSALNDAGIHNSIFGYSGLLRKFIYRYIDSTETLFLSNQITGCLVDT